MTTRGVLCSTLIALLFPSGIAMSGEWSDFSEFLGYGLAVEDVCDNYLLYTDPVMGNHLPPGDYAQAMEGVPIWRLEKAARVVDIGCPAAALEVSSLRGLAFDEVWEVR